MRLKVDCYDNAPQSFVTSSGSPERTIYSGVVRSDGSLDLVVSGTEDIQQKINSFASECDISNILARFTAGDTGALNARPVNYGDFTQMPKSMIEAYNIIKSGEDNFALLPESVRDVYGNDFLRWLADAGSPKWIKALSDVGQSVVKSDLKVDVVEPIKKEVSVDA